MKDTEGNENKPEHAWSRYCYIRQTHLVFQGHQLCEVDRAPEKPSKVASPGGVGDIGHSSVASHVGQHSKFLGTGRRGPHDTTMGLE